MSNHYGERRGNRCQVEPRVRGYEASEVDERLGWARSQLGDEPAIQEVVTEALRFRR